MEINKINQIDKEHVWHPYTSITNPLPVYAVERAEGCTILLKDGRKLIDGMSSWWAAVHGYNHPVLNEVIENQLKQMSHIMFGGLTHEPAVELAELLLSIIPEGLNKIFYCDSGSVAVEVAMKMALQYWSSQGKPAKNKFASIRNGYHGDTWHAMSVCDPDTGMHHIFNGKLAVQLFAEQPNISFYDEWDDACFVDMQKLIEEHHSDMAAIILEPVVQGAGGMWFYHPEYLGKLHALCTQYDVLLIADEIATGFGRTGEMFACNHANITPDIMCVGKAITGGYMSFAAAIATDKVATTICNGEPGVFMHGPTFMGNPLACAVAKASISLLVQNDWKAQVKAIEEILQQELDTCKSMKNVADVRCLGAIGVVELKHSVDMATIQKQFVNEGIWVRPFGKLVYLMPPFVISESELRQLCQSLVKVLKTVEAEFVKSKSLAYEL